MTLLRVSLLLLLFSRFALAECTSFCFCAGDTVLFGNTLDWHVGEGLVVINKRNVTKTALFCTNPAQWTSKYGSVTVNQWGCEFPARGMNEAGLVTGEMTLQETRFPVPDDRPAVILEQWIQYQLDNCATVAEVLESDKLIRINNDQYTSHFLVADKSGNCITMEWLNGELVYHTMDMLPAKVLTNSTYESSLAFYKSGNTPAITDYSSLARFYRVTDMFTKYNPSTSGSALDYAWNILASVNRGERTKWTLLFDVTNQRLYFKTWINPEKRYLKFKECNFSCATPVKIADINTPLKGNIMPYCIDYDYNTNRTLVTTVAKKQGPQLPETPDWMIDRISHYPEQTICGGKGNKP